ncbi:MAG: DNA-binding protein [Candidatus Omnitrophota bacterium]|jgi:hypothetical protein
MIRRKLTQFLLLAAGCWLLVTSCYAEESVSSADLINNAKEYDGKEIVYQGEVIGDVMARKEFAWINVNDGANAIGIWLAKDLVKVIAYTGSYKSRGDIVEIKGIFHRSCIEHGGDLDIHAAELRKAKEGALMEEKFDNHKRNIALILFGILGLITLSSLLKFKTGKSRRNDEIHR